MTSPDSLILARRALRPFAMAAMLTCTLMSTLALAQPKTPTPDQQKEVERLDTEHRTKMAQRDYAGAITTARQLWNLKQKIYGADADEAETYKRSLAETMDVAGNYVEAIELLHEIAATAAKKHGAESQELVYALQRLESVLNTVQRWDELDTVYQRVLALKKKLSGENSAIYVTELGSYVSFLVSQTQYTAAQRLAEQEIKIREQLTAGKPDPHLALALLALARIYWDTQQQAKAIPTFDRAIAMATAAPGAQAMTTAPMIAAIATTYRLGGRPELAPPLEKRARDMYTQEIARLEKGKPTDPMLSTTLGLLGQMQWLTDDLAGAEQNMTRAMELDRRAGRTSAWTPMLSQVKRAQGKPQDALALLERATADFAKMSNVKNVYASMLADVYADLGEYQKAQAQFEDYLAQIGKGHGKKSPEYGTGLLRLAMNDVKRGNISDAEPRLTEGLEVTERDLIQTLKSGTESDHRAWFRRNGYQLDLAISFHLAHAPKSAGAARLALTTLLRRKGRVLDAAATSLATIRTRLSPADQQLLDELATARGQLSKRKIAGPGSDPDTFAKEVATFETQIQDLELKLSQKSASYRALSLPIELTAIQKLIPARSKLVEIVNYQPFDLARKTATKGTLPPRRYLAYVVGHSGDPAEIDLGPADAIDQAVTALRKALANPKNDRATDLAHAMYELTFAKIAPKLETTTDLLMAPDGTLNLVPFAALVDDQQAYLVKRFTFTYLTSGRDLLRLNVKTRGQSGSVIFADPTFETSTPTDEANSRGARSADLSSINWPQLPGTRQEAEQVVKTMKRFKLYAGNEATESALKQLHGPRILHLATHGFFLRDKPRTPSRGLDLPAGPPSPAPVEENPLLRAGLALAGANQHVSGNEDGILTALEATGLDLWGTKLVVLSACQTGDGKVTNGDGVYGLRRALVLAGAEALMMTLWQVDDFATRDLMVGFYRLLHKGRPRSSALREMQIELLEQPKYAHPYFWASFVPTGENAPIKD